MATVKDMVVRFAQIVDPYTKAGVALTSSTIDDTDGDRFTIQRRLDIYNDARFALFRAMRKMMSRKDLTEAISGNVVETQIEFTAASNRYEYTLPTGYVRFISLDGFSTTSKKMEPILLLPTTYVGMVRLGQMLSYVQTNNIRFVFEIGTKLIHFGTYLADHLVTGTVEVDIGISDTTITGTSTLFFAELAVGAKVTITGTEKTIATITSNTGATVTVAYTGSKGAGSPMSVKNYHLKYFGITVYTTSDLADSTEESFNSDYHHILIELAVAIANEQGMVKVNALAKELLEAA